MDPREHPAGVPAASKATAFQLRLVESASVVLTTLIFVPLLAMAALGLLRWRFTRWSRSSAPATWSSRPRRPTPTGWPAWATATRARTTPRSSTPSTSGATGSVKVYESGALRGGFGSYVAGDRFRVGVEFGVVKYRKNGTVFYTSTVAPATRCSLTARSISLEPPSPTW